jgi:hypothetical protein
MEIVQIRSKPKQTFFAPEYCFILGETQIEGIDWSKIKNFILQLEKDALARYPDAKTLIGDAYTGLGPDSLTARFEHYNVFMFNDPEIQKLKEKVHEQYLIFLEKFGAPRPKVYMQCWANVMRKGQKIEPHIHGLTEWTYLGGHITVACDGTYTNYMNPLDQLQGKDQYYSENRVGQLTFFQNNIPHYTTIHQADTERITIAFDILPEVGTGSFQHVPTYFVFDQQPK